QPAQIGGKYVPQVHAVSVASSSICAPRYIEQSDFLRHNPRGSCAALGRGEVGKMKPLNVLDCGQIGAEIGAPAGLVYASLINPHHGFILPWVVGLSLGPIL